MITNPTNKRPTDPPNESTNERTSERANEWTNERNGTNKIHQNAKNTRELPKTNINHNKSAWNFLVKLAWARSKSVHSKRALILVESTTSGQDVWFEVRRDSAPNEHYKYCTIINTSIGFEFSLCERKKKQPFNTKIHFRLVNIEKSRRHLRIEASVSTINTDFYHATCFVHSTCTPQSAHIWATCRL